MKIWMGVYIYAGNIESMRAFGSRELAKGYFDEFVNQHGGKDACDVGDYHDKANHLYFFDSMKGGRNELRIDYVEVIGYA